MKRRVVIIGGGLAGIAAAVRLADAGDQSVIIETRKRLGGRATSLVDPRSDLTIDNCQHVLLGCCTNLIDLYERLGVLDRIEWHRTLHWTRGASQRHHVDRLRGGLLPAPLHLAFSFQRMRCFSFAEKRHIARAMWCMIRMGEKGRHAWSDRTFAAFLESCGQPRELIRAFWNTIIVSACNLDVDRVGAAPALQVFQQGFLANKFAYVMGLATVPLADLYEPAVPIIEATGGGILWGCSAKSIAYDGNRVQGVVTEDGLIEGAAVISAVPFDRLGKLATPPLQRADARLQMLDRFTVSPILGVHLWFDQIVMDLPHLVLVDREVQWLFNKGQEHSEADSTAGRNVPTRQHIHAVISAADAWMGLEEPEIVRRVMIDIHHVLPRSVGLEPIEARSIKERRATFAPIPGVDFIRPSAAPGYVGSGGGGVANLFLAGDWIDTGWPATMEGAVRSGYAAAAACASEARGVVDDIPTAWLAKLAGLR